MKRETVLRIGFHAVVVVLLSVKVILWTIYQGKYVRSMQQTYEYLFTNPFVEVAEPQRMQLFTYNETEHYAQRILSTYLTINNLTTTEMQYGYSSNSGQKSCSSVPAAMTVQTCSWTSTTTLSCTDTSVITPNEFPFYQNLPATYFGPLDSMRLQFDLCNFVNVVGSNHDCNYWTVEIFFQSVAAQYLEVDVTSTLVEKCQESHSSSSLVSQSSVWLDIFLTIFVVFYSLFVLSDLLASFLIYQNVKACHALARAKYEKDTKRDERVHEVAAMYSWNEIPTGVKRSLHNYWSLITLVGLISCFIQSMIALSNPYDELDNLENSQKFFIGLALLLLWMSLVQFLSIRSPVYAISVTIQMALPRMLAFMSSFLPVYLAFLFLGMALFGAKLGFFASVDSAGKFLFALMAGDSVMQIMQLMTKLSIWASLIFGVSFTLVTAYLLVNIFIAIVEEAYFVARKQGRHLELLMWRNLQNIALEERKAAGLRAAAHSNDSDDSVQFDAQSSRVFFSANNQHLTPAGSPTTSPVNKSRKRAAAAGGRSHRAAAGLLVQLQNMPDADGHQAGGDADDDEPIMTRSQYDRLAEDLLQATMPDSHAAHRLPLDADDLTITLAEETAEMYILGRNHWEYSKMMDYIAEHVDD